MSSTTYAIRPPSSANGTGSDRGTVSQCLPPQAASTHLSPHSSLRTRSNSASPILNIDTPAGSISASSVHYQSSDYSDFCGDDPYYGIDFDNADNNSPSFLEWDTVQGDHPAASGSSQVPPGLEIPDLQNASSPHGGQQGENPPPVLQHQQKSAHPQVAATGAQLPTTPSPYQLTPSTSAESPTSNDGLAPEVVTHNMSGQSPRLTLTFWDNDASDEASPSNTVEDVIHVGYGHSTAAAAGSTSRDDQGQWLPDEATGHRGLTPDRRRSTELDASPNEQAIERGHEENNQVVQSWLERSPLSDMPINPNRHRPEYPDVQDDNIDPKAIPDAGTENKLIPGQTYFPESGSGEVTRDDINIMLENRNWADGPVLQRIHNGPVKYQPETAQDAIAKFESQCRDNDQMSRVATWGTRRRSCPSVLDIEGVTSGNFLKKLSIGQAERVRRPSILDNVRELLRSPSTTLKRSRTPDHPPAEAPADRKGSQDTLAPPVRTPSGGLGKQSGPSINTALVNASKGAAFIGATHVRNGSVGSPIVSSPKSPILSSFGVSIKRRDRSGSELVGMWKSVGGPPVANLAKPPPPADHGDDDDEDDDLDEDAKMRNGSSEWAQDVEPTLAGFGKHIQKFNPHLLAANHYLVERIAYQQTVRYKDLLDKKIKHLKAVQARSCPSAGMCVQQGGSAKLDGIKSESGGSEGDTSPLEGGISSESFPPNIPMPPTSSLPAEMECQVCFQAKKFQKPSDWTKHIHEDVQPFTCTWEHCKDPKVFKRKADWVRHENEGHRHLEWWACDVDDCHHLCYRRDNFLQHLVREHKYTEPKFKTKAAVKRSGAADPIWQTVERCHHETPTRPQDEPCRFCNRSFTTWKKLIVHVAKHMEIITLSVLAIADRQDVTADTIVSPVQDPPPRHFAPPTPSTPDPAAFSRNPAVAMARATQSISPHAPMFYPVPTQLRRPLAYDANQAAASAHSQGRPAPPQPLYNAPAVLGSTPMPSHTHHQHAHQFNPATSDFSPTHFGGIATSPACMGVGAAAYNDLPTSATTFTPSHDLYSPAAASGGHVEPFPTLPMNVLGLQDPSFAADGQLPYGPMIDTTVNTGVGVGPYQAHEYISPYSPSPHQPQNRFYGQHGPR